MKRIIFPKTVDLSLTTWRKRAIHYLLIWFTLVTALVSLRYFTYPIRTHFLNSLKLQQELVTQRDNLAVTLQISENPQRVRDWAISNGLKNFAESHKDYQTLIPKEKLKDMSQAVKVSQAVEVKTEWK